MNTSLSTAIEILVGQIRGYESDTFSAEAVGMDQQLAERIAARVIHTLLFDEEGMPGEVDGGLLRACHNLLVTGDVANQS